MPALFILQFLIWLKTHIYQIKKQRHKNSKQYKNKTDINGQKKLKFSSFQLETERNKFLLLKLNRNRISATILVSAKTETLSKLKFMFLCIMKRLQTNYKLEKYTWKDLYISNK